MKKIMLAAVALICMTITTVALTACGSDSSSSTPTPPPAPTMTTSEWNISFTQESNAVVQQNLPVKVCYYDAAGTLKTEDMTGASWNKSVTYQGETSNKGFFVIRLITGKEGVVAEDSYPVSLTPSGTIVNSYSDGSKVTLKVNENPLSKFSGTTIMGQFKGQGIINYFDNGRKYLNYLGCFSLYKDGTISITNGTSIPEIKELMGKE